MKTSVMKLLILMLVFITVFHSGCKKVTVEKLLQQRKFADAEEFCEDLEGEEKKKCLEKVALHYFRDDNFNRAALVYARAGVHSKVISSYLLAKNPAEAEAYCNRQKGETLKRCALQLATVFFRNGNYDRAIHYYLLGGEADKVEIVKAKIPAFKLVEALGKVNAAPKTALKGLDIPAFTDTIKAYIFLDLDGYGKWRFGREAETDKTAALDCEKAFKMIETIAAPAFIEHANRALSTPAPTGIELKTLVFDHVRLDSLVNLVKSLFKIGGARKFLNDNSVEYFDDVFTKALTHAKGLFGTLEDFEKETDFSLLDDYRNDLEVDIEIIDYISGMLDNIQTRINEIDMRIKKILKKSTSLTLSTESKKQMRSFVAVCSQVLRRIADEDYKTVNKLLLGGYNKAKEELSRLEEVLTGETGRETN
jgi:hypothetical protein